MAKNGVFSQFLVLVVVVVVVVVFFMHNNNHDIFGNEKTWFLCFGCWSSSIYIELKPIANHCGSRQLLIQLLSVHLFLFFFDLISPINHLLCFWYCRLSKKTIIYNNIKSMMIIDWKFLLELFCCFFFSMSNCRISNLIVVIFHCNL